MNILGIETSCDETAVSVVREEKGKLEALSNVVSSQVELHSKWGGVVPNLAAREHLKNILPVLEESLEKAGKKMPEIDLIAVTRGPGLIPALLIGTNAAKTLAYRFKKPLLGIHHIEGHIYANFIQDKVRAKPKPQKSNSKQIPNPKRKTSKQLSIEFPILCLVVSGGHTQLVLMKDHLQYEVIGRTLDDAAGEAFDKTARILGLGYPGGPIISKIADSYRLDAEKYDSSPSGYKPASSPRWSAIELPRPMINSGNFDFSFSGLKTAVLYAVKRNEKFAKEKKFVSKMCYEFEQAAIDVLVSKTVRAAQKFNPRTVMLAGGVSANKELCRRLGEIIEKEIPDASYVMPGAGYSLDNAAMIGTAGFFRFQKIKNKKKLFDGWKTLQADADLKLEKESELAK